MRTDIWINLYETCFISKYVHLKKCTHKIINNIEIWTKCLINLIQLVISERDSYIFPSKSFLVFMSIFRHSLYLMSLSLRLSFQTYLQNNFFKVLEFRELWNSKVTSLHRPFTLVYSACNGFLDSSGILIWWICIRNQNICSSLKRTFKTNLFKRVCP